MKQLLQRLRLRNPYTTVPGIVVLVVGAHVCVKNGHITEEAIALFTLGTGLIAAKDGHA